MSAPRPRSPHVLDGLGADVLCSIAAAGGGLTVSSRLGASALFAVAEAASTSGAFLIVVEAATLSVEDLQAIARVGRGCVHFEG